MMFWVSRFFFFNSFFLISFSSLFLPSPYSSFFPNIFSPIFWPPRCFLAQSVPHFNLYFWINIPFHYTRILTTIFLPHSIFASLTLTNLFPQCTPPLSTQFFFVFPVASFYVRFLGFARQQVPPPNRCRSSPSPAVLLFSHTLCISLSLFEVGVAMCHTPPPPQIPCRSQASLAKILWMKVSFSLTHSLFSLSHTPTLSLTH